VHATSLQNTQNFIYKWIGSPLPVNVLQRLNRINSTDNNFVKLLSVRDSKQKIVDDIYERQLFFQKS
jgi:hypothetical protein